ncbi:hypothetical protein KIN_19680 [Litoreibacter roseus]|uniref:Glycosyltransferase 61 catalytic domain-containing protein n=2 Tax=Litoreibacter roseus TaxID=2601869 RepID=A0A6N6JFI0_9RHOB|nr:hypothetical protein KIN_19680 [Litoreibacter roseus]
MDFSPAIMDPTGQSLDLREIRYRPFHAALAARPPDLVMDHAVWIAERVFDNHSHWLSAHLPKLVLLKDRGQLTDLVLPEKRPQTVDDSLRMLSIDPEDCAVLPLNAVLYAKTLTLVENDRFDPALLNATRAALAPTRTPTRRIFISRKAAKGRKLIEEEQLMPVLTEAGFETVVMEHLNFAEQIDLMSETAVLLAPHGAGLTNMLFCPIGTRVIEMADPAYPNPNFYAMAAALGLPYALIAAKGVGAAHPLEQDLSVDPAEVARVLALI